jgi:hypothetical protein
MIALLPIIVGILWIVDQNSKLIQEQEQREKERHAREAKKHLHHD